MIKLGKLTDYAITVMAQLAKEGGDILRSAHYLSEKTGVAEPTVAKVLKALSKGNLIISTRGSMGGYKLSKTAEQISLADIIKVLDGPIKIVSCVGSHEGSCKTQSTCPVFGNFDRVNDAIIKALDGVKLVELVVPNKTNYVVMREAR